MVDIYSVQLKVFPALIESAGGQDINIEVVECNWLTEESTFRS